MIFVFPVAQNNGANIFIAVTHQLNAALVDFLVWGAKEFVAVVVADVVIWGSDFAVLDLLLHHAELVAVLCAVGLCAAVVLVEAVLNLTLVRSLDIGCEIHTEEIISRSSV